MMPGCVITAPCSLLWVGAKQRSHPRSLRSEAGRPDRALSALERACKPVGGWLPIEVGFGLTERGWAGAEPGMACEAGSGAGARRDYGDRGRVSRAQRGRL